MCLRRQFSTLLEHSAKVRELLLTAMNSGLRDEVTALATQGGALHRKHPVAAPVSGAGLPITAMSFMRLRELVEDGARTSLIERMAFLETGVQRNRSPERGEGEGSPKRGGAPNSPPACPGRHLMSGQYIQGPLAGEADSGECVRSCVAGYDVSTCLLKPKSPEQRGPTPHNSSSNRSSSSKRGCLYRRRRHRRHNSRNSIRQP